MDINYTSDNSNVNSILYEAQLIATAFSKALEDNNCLIASSPFDRCMFYNHD